MVEYYFDKALTTDIHYNKWTNRYRINTLRELKQTSFNSSKQIKL